MPNSKTFSAVVPIESEDKKGYDKTPPSTPPCSMPRRSRICYCSPPGHGKTANIKNCLVHSRSDEDPWRHVVVITGVGFRRRAAVSTAFPVHTSAPSKPPPTLQSTTPTCNQPPRLSQKVRLGCSRALQGRPGVRSSPRRTSRLNRNPAGGRRIPRRLTGRRAVANSRSPWHRTWMCGRRSFIIAFFVFTFDWDHGGESF